MASLSHCVRRREKKCISFLFSDWERSSDSDLWYIRFVFYRDYENIFRSNLVKKITLLLIKDTFLFVQLYPGKNKYIPISVTELSAGTPLEKVYVWLWRKWWCRLYDKMYSPNKFIFSFICYQKSRWFHNLRWFWSFSPSALFVCLCLFFVCKGDIRRFFGGEEMKATVFI